ncbi:hypothetical protein J7E50_04460 [Pedobacter sp. ISL-68]|uniref:S41 family peptidase n=1 Tax=unclassified Pedobacter TaxID=2628915 RepID=UPI001BE7372A|nr:MULTISPECIES: S41 family peptidase [unclassified Pedobacter]MBT2563567.1 hypothetical protein [Pedobacter sp. ISL-64]MBT2589458.1 hypothetical protein [Pedobacter sp. ISL-68]
MKKNIFYLLLLFPFYNLQAQNCNCGDNFSYLTNRITKNYVGYADKVTPANSQHFKKFTDSLQQVANQANSYKCLSLCREWLSFFKDKHVDFGMDFGKLNPDSVRIFFANEEKTSWTENTFKSYLQQNKTTLDSIEGIWNYGIYEIGIVKDQTKTATEFIGFVMKADSSRWMPQQIKLKIRETDNQYQTIFFNGGDHSVNYPKLNIRKDLLDFGFFGQWKRGEKKTKTVYPPKFTAPDLMSSFKVLDNQTSLLTLPSFDSKYKLRIDSLVASNKDNLEHTEHLIVDVRDNPGGSTHCFEKLIPYLYTNPIHVDGGLVLATADNIRDCYEKDYPYATAASKRTMKRNNKKLRAHMGELYQLYNGNTIKRSKVLKNPSRISILINGSTASSGELFILRAEQSKKVTLFGQNSAGCVDYGEMVIIHLPCNVFNLVYPAAKSFHAVKRPLDNIGITPQVKIGDNVTDWIEFVKKYKN